MFHHMTIGSPNGGPPRSSRRTGSPYDVRVSVLRPGGTWKPARGHRLDAAVAGPPTPTTPVSTRPPSSKGSVDVELEDGVLLQDHLGAEQRVAVGTGEVSPSNEPRNTRASQPGPVTASDVVAKPGR